MIACLDVDYRDAGAVAACVLADSLESAVPAGERVARITVVAPYEPGAFYRRELPCLQAVLTQVTEPLSLIVVDGYVWLDAGRPGLGAHLHEALGRAVPVLGVAKTAFRGGAARPVLRGQSLRPLYVSAVGLDLAEAVAQVQRMHGAHRVPALLQRVDRLCRSALLGAD